MSVSDLRPGQNALIQSILGNGKLSKRLLALGCTNGTKITFKTSAPFGDPVIINIRGFDLAIRRRDAQNILVKEA